MQWSEYQNEIWWHEIQNEFQENTKKYHKYKDPNKDKSIFRKILNMPTFKFVKRCDCHNHITKNATLLDIWLTYSWNLLVNKFKETSLKPTSILDLLTSVAPRCFYGTQKRCSTEQNNEEIPPHGTTYWALTIWSWNFNSTTYLEKI